ncbi:unnamed protein product [Didymodactylos carnosus]|uniref:Uncharacterized protein n=1 Tax=Didymodactylos carnosus TaxID=1234261 RepID=A0A8S2Z386_9BILA|nr:unnamed protein product [Didymodactylos carnosus]
MRHRRNTGIQNYVNFNGVKILESILVSYYKKSASIVENRSVMNFLIDCVLYLASEMTALRDHDAKDGKFYIYFECYASSYLKTLSNRQLKPDLNFLSRVDKCGTPTLILLKSKEK